MKLLFLLLIMGSSSIASTEKEMKGRVVGVIDGNTLEVIDDKEEKQKIVLAGIDCPDAGQEYAKEAKRFLEKLVLRQEITFTIVGKDRLGNNLAVLKVKRNVDPRVELLKEGLAWTAERNPLPELEAYRLEAEKNQKGLWKEENPTPPWLYRRQQSMMEAKSN
ncbi:thermonuclease family protein [Chryseosolibacter indicus]|uniref:Thermonuclease family protein n=1 Tax=Chryseosolibacter indicus TaxID=2782351 RepID=A0ABS5VMH8_9BACT|nr:thermonuclease family protein [Chryseosolibacter indicus]MBT1701977.1 thermonuclease family protein [Chryseosolibacter indicus]